MKIKNILLSLSVFVSVSQGFDYSEQNMKTETKESKNISSNVSQPQQNNQLLVPQQQYSDNAQLIQNDVLNKNNSKSLEQSELKAYNNGFDEGYEHGKRIAEEEMIAKLHKLEKYLDNIFNFQRLYIENKIEPPKIMVRKSPVEVMENGKLMIIEQEQIEIIEPARLLAQPRKWQHFIIE